jgi:hypothetical protein
MSSISRITIVGNFFLIIFPIIFAGMVTQSLFIENIKMKEFIASEDEDICSTTMFLNVSLAIVLAALWNGNRIIKIGVI